MHLQKLMFVQSNTQLIFTLKIIQSAMYVSMHRLIFSLLEKSVKIEDHHGTVLSAILILLLKKLKAEKNEKFCSVFESADKDFYHLDLADCFQTWHVYLPR